MVKHRIVCTIQEPLDKPHEVAHIVSVGIGDNPDQAASRMELKQVLDTMTSGDTFYTRGKSSGKEASVHKYTCKDCGRDTIRSGADSVEDNNLDKLRKCNFS